MSGILIVDDLPVIRAGIATILTQHQVPLQPYLQAADGKDAVQIARRYKPDIILMDIKMPNLDGLQAAAMIRAEQPDVKVVMLTAYDEFSYMQKALKMGARDYLLKPVRPARLIELLAEIQKEIAEERRSQRTMEIVKDSLQKTLPVIEANLVENLVRGTTPDSASLEESLGFLSKRLSRPAVMVTKIDGFDNLIREKTANELQILYLSMMELIRNLLPKPQQALIGYSKPGRVITILSCEPPLTAVEQIQALAESIRGSIKTEMGLTVTIGIGSTYADWEAIPLSYAEANLARRMQNRQGDTTVHIEQVSVTTLERSEDSSYRIQHEQDLIASIQINDQPRAVKLTNEIVDYLAERFKTNPEGFKYSCAELAITISWAVIASGIDQRSVLKISHRQVMNLDAQKSMQEVRAWTMNSLSELMAALEVQAAKQDAVSQAVAYLQTNYRRADISLQEVADVVCLSASYLGAQLRESLGMSYMKYLTLLRIEEAKRLLRTTDHSIVYIAQQVGYPNVTNFYRHFQRIEEKTPLLYRQEEA